MQRPSLTKEYDRKRLPLRRRLLQGRVSQQSTPVLLAQVKAQYFKGAFALAQALFENPQIVPEDKERHKVMGVVGAGKMFLALDQGFEDAVDVLNG